MATYVESTDNDVVECTSVEPELKAHAAGHEGEACKTVTDPGSYNNPDKRP